MTKCCTGNEERQNVWGIILQTPRSENEEGEGGSASGVGAKSAPHPMKETIGAAHPCRYPHCSMWRLSFSDLFSATQVVQDDQVLYEKNS